MVKVPTAPKGYYLPGRRPARSFAPALHLFARPSYAMNRRTALLNSALLGAAALGASRLPAHAAASPALPPTARPAGFKRLTLGRLELTILTDGHILTSPVQPFVAPGIDPALVTKTLAAHYRPTTSIDLAMNVVLVQTPTRLVLLDAGLGVFADGTGQNGWLLRSLAEAGVAPAAITDVILSHAHPDHIGGLLDQQQQLVFANATYHIARPEFDFWLQPAPDFSRSELRHQPAFLADVLKGIRHALDVIRPRLRFLDLARPLYDCFTFELAPGHTPGLTLTTISSGPEQLTYIADLIHSDALLFAHPEWGFSGDTDLRLAATTRRRMLQQYATTRRRILAYHLPWPGLGYVAPQNAAFAWVPEVFATP